MRAVCCTLLCFFFQAEDGIRDLTVTGVQTCALPIYGAFAYVANDQTENVSVIDTSTNTVVSIVPVGLTPRGVAITPDGAFAYVTNEVDSTVSVINTATNAVVDTVRGVTVLPEGLAILPQPGAVACR